MKFLSISTGLIIFLFYFPSFGQDADIDSLKNKVLTVCDDIERNLKTYIIEKKVKEFKTKFEIINGDTLWSEAGSPFDITEVYYDKNNELKLINHTFGQIEGIYNKQINTYYFHNNQLVLLIEISEVLGWDDGDEYYLYEDNYFFKDKILFKQEERHIESVSIKDFNELQKLLKTQKPKHIELFRKYNKTDLKNCYLNKTLHIQKYLNN